MKYCINYQLLLLTTVLSTRKQILPFHCANCCSYQLISFCILLKNFTRILNKFFLKQTKKNWGRKEGKCNVYLTVTELYFYFLKNVYDTNIFISSSCNDCLNVFDSSVSCQWLHDFTFVFYSRKVKNFRDKYWKPVDPIVG